MSAYPPDQTDSGFGPNFDSMNPWQKAALMMNPKALQIMQYVQNLSAQKEDRERRRQIFDLDLEDRRRRRAEDDFKTQLTLSDAGMLPVQPGVVGKFEAAMSGRGTVTAPDGSGQYSRPSPEQKATRTGKLKGIAETAESAAAEEEGRRSGRLIEVTIPVLPGDPTDQPARKMWIPREKSMDYIRATREIKAGKFAKSEFRTDPQTGKTYFFGIDADTGETIEREMGTVMSPKLAGAGKEPLPTNAEIEALMQEWRPNLYNSRGITPEVQEAAKGMGKTEGSVMGGEGNPAAVRIRAAEKELRDAATDEVKARIRNSGGARTKGAAVAGKKEPVPASKLESLLADPRVKARGIKDVNALRKDLAGHGYQIDEAK